MNLADALLLPQDDLALAVALKSPLFSLTDDDLFKLAWQRRGSLRHALTAQGATDDRFRAALTRLEQCERRLSTKRRSHSMPGCSAAMAARAHPATARPRSQRRDR
jgi:ATP-dependent helicase/nuclease subunit A